MKQRELEHAFRAYTVTVYWKKIKHAYIKILPTGKIVCMVPHQITLAEVDKLLEKKSAWLDAKVIARRNVKNKDTFDYKRGELHYFLGKAYFLEIVITSGKRNVFLLNDRMILSTHKGDNLEDYQNLLKRWYRVQFDMILPSLIRECEVITKQTAHEWRIKSMKSRWGSCNIAKRRIWLNLSLIRHPVEVIKYVMIHELIHFYERFHNERFYYYMAKFLPEYKELDLLLNSI